MVDSFMYQFKACDNILMLTINKQNNQIKFDGVQLIKIINSCYNQLNELNQNGMLLHDLRSIRKLCLV